MSHDKSGADDKASKDKITIKIAGADDETSAMNGLPGYSIRARIENGWDREIL